MSILKKIFSKPFQGRFYFIEKILGFPPQNLDNYKKAFTHRSSNKLDLNGSQ
jgi:ribonuclease-3